LLKEDLGFQDFKSPIPFRIAVKRIGKALLCFTEGKRELAAQQFSPRVLIERAWRIMRVSRAA
jgi:hypothetical protein